MVKLKNIAQESFLYFNKAVRGRRVEQHHEEWDYYIRNNKRLLLECARAHGKTDFISIGLPLWFAYREVPIEILIVSYSEEQASDIMRKIEMEINTNPMLSHLKPSQSTTWQTTLFTFSSGVRIKAVGFGTSVRGQHPDIIIVDDPLKDTGALDPEQQYDYFMGALSGTAKRDTKILVIGTPLDPGDLLSRLEDNPVYTFKSYPAYKDGEPLFPYLFNKQDLDFIKQEKGSLVFAREYLLQRIDPETQVFKDKYLTLNNNIEYPPFVCVRTLVDPAISEKEAACDSAIVTVGLDASNQFWELDTRLVHSDDANKMLLEVVKSAQIYRDYGDYAICFEGELFQKLLAFELRKILTETGLNVRVIEVTHVGTTGKHQRIQSLQPRWEARAIKLIPESPLIRQFQDYRPRAKNIRVDALDAVGWMTDERVCVPFTYSTPYIGEVPEDVR